MTIDWAAAAVLLTGISGLCAGNLLLVRLVVRDEIQKANFLPRPEAELRDREIDRRIAEVAARNIFERTARQ